MVPRLRWAGEGREEVPLWSIRGSYARKSGLAALASQLRHNRRRLFQIHGFAAEGRPPLRTDFFARRCRTTFVCWPGDTHTF
jgi:hypothetical protein